MTPPEPSALDRLDPWPQRSGYPDPRFDYVPGGTDD